MAFSIIGIDGLAASNYISNKVPQWEDSPFQHCISLFVFTDNVATLSLLKYEDCLSVINELLTEMHRLAAYRPQERRSVCKDTSLFLLILILISNTSLESDHQNKQKR